ncbi:polymer-forming cytoskeletal protein [Microbacterium foliorum]
MISNPNDSALEKRVAALEELLRANPFESASVKNGRLRFIGGLLRVDSGGRVQIVGTLEIDGTTTVTGVFDVEGPWDLAGDGSITGNVSIAGNVTATGEWTQIGEWHLNGNGSITGDVDITGILTLLSELRVSTIGKITVGNMVIDPSNGGSVTFPGGAVVRAASGGGVVVEQGNYSATVTNTGASLGRSGRSFTVRDAFPPFQFVGLPTISVTNSGGLPINSMYVSPQGEPYKVVAD